MKTSIIKVIIITCLMSFVTVLDVGSAESFSLAQNTDKNISALKYAYKILGIEISFAGQGKYSFEYKISFLSSVRQEQYINAIVQSAKPFKFTPPVDNSSFESMEVASIKIDFVDESFKRKQIEIIIIDGYLFWNTMFMINSFYAKDLIPLLIEDIKRFPDTESSVEALSKILYRPPGRGQVKEFKDYYEYVR